VGRSHRCSRPVGCRRGWLAGAAGSLDAGARRRRYRSAVGCSGKLGPTAAARREAWTPGPDGGATGQRAGCGWKLGPTAAARSQLEASFLVQVKNPDSPSSHSGRGGGDGDRFHCLQSKRRVMLPHLQGASGPPALQAVGV
jgi:hypothetical protein